MSGTCVILIAHYTLAIGNYHQHHHWIIICRLYISKANVTPVFEAHTHSVNVGKSVLIVALSLDIIALLNKALLHHQVRGILIHLLSGIHMRAPCKHVTSL